MSFSFRTAFTASHNFWYVLFPFLFISRFFFNLYFDLFFDPLVANTVLFFTIYVLFFYIESSDIWWQVFVCFLACFYFILLKVYRCLWKDFFFFLDAHSLIPEDCFFFKLGISYNYLVDCIGRDH